ncbi:TetR/AcrR family transcriptional regulator [Arthrobacter sp. HLT1-20]
MSTPYLERGRSGQKRRTLNALVDAAREMIAAGKTPTVDEAALASGVARSTAYRYFPGQRELLAAAHPETGLRSILPENSGDDPAERLAAVVHRFTAMIVETENQQRTMLRLSLEPATPVHSLPLRQGRAIPWITEALEPLRGTMSEAEIHRLVLAIRSATGIESLVWLTDVGGLSREQAVESMRWSAQALLRQALEVGAPRL